MTNRFAVRKIVWVIGLLVLLIGMSGLSSAEGGSLLQGNALAQTAESTSEPTAMPTVTANDQWAPATQTFDDVEMVLVPPGCFMMGSESGEDNEKPVHQVCFDKPFWIDKYEVTNGQFNRLGGEAKSASRWTDDNRPREQITWIEANAFCAKRGSRLPTEAEWEYAARGPDGLIYSWGNDFLADNTVYYYSSLGRTAEVGSRPGGVSWVGAFDLSGNVQEWVADWYSEAYYTSSPKLNPQGPSSGQNRALRGGSWFDFEDFARAPSRRSGSPDHEDNNIGFRCARSSD